MKSHVNRSPATSCLASELLGAVLAHDGHATLGERRKALDGQVLDRREDLHGARVTPAVGDRRANALRDLP